MILQGDSIEVLKTLEAGSVDALVTDPPYGLNNITEQGGNVSRFFYTTKPTRKEREAGLDAPNGQRANVHPTVKPIDLMRYLCRLITPPQGVVLDPFTGSGSTGCAAALEGFEFIGIEREAEYVEIAQQRTKHWQAQKPTALDLFLKK